ncbi:MAG: hypothetical protein KDD36_14625 [Flavobacteriales bacterium]|nr:hypothetical protein [Flavobacteriales bacterium]
MKRFVSILLSLITLTATSGVAVGTHYCGGKKVDTSVITIKGPHDPCCSNMKCCKDQVEFFKVSSEFSLDAPIQFAPVFSTIQTIYQPFVFSQRPIHNYYSRALVHPPPNFHTQHSFLQVFLI